MWAQAQAQLQEAVKAERGAPEGNSNAAKGENKSAHRAELNPDPTVGSYGKPTDRKSRLIRTLTNLKDDPEACQVKGTTPGKVQEAPTPPLTPAAT